MKKFMFIMPLMAVSLLASCGSKPTEDITHKFTFTGEHCKINGDYEYSHDIFEKDKNVKYTITPDPEYSIPVSLGGDPVDYDNETGVITISEIKSDTNVTATAVYSPTGVTHHFIFRGTDCIVNGDAIYECDIPIGKPFKCTIVPRDEYLNPTNINIEVGENITYNKDNGVISISAMTSDVEINATSQPAASFFTFTFLGSDCTINNQELYIDQVEKGKTDVEYEISPKLGFTMPQSCSGLPAGVTYTKSGDKGILTIAQMSQSYQVNVSANESSSDITLVVKDPGNFSFTTTGGKIDSVNWGDKTINTSNSHSYGSGGTYLIKICFTGVTSFSLTNNTAVTEIIYNSTELSTVSDSAFKSCANLLYFSAPELTSIGQHAFEDCPKLSTVTVADNNNLKTIGASAFANCTSLDDAEFFRRVETIGNSAFMNTAVFDVEISSYCTSLGSYAFSKCFRLTSIAMSSFVYERFNDHVFSDCYSLKDVYGLYNSAVINDYAFSNCYSLVTNPTYLSVVGAYAFENCLNLQHANFVDNQSYAHSVGEGAFKNCLGMNYVTLGGLTGTTFYSGSQYMFDNCKDDFEIRVPSGMLNTYKNAEHWSTYSSHIVGM